jgi:hypothetical protein
VRLLFSANCKSESEGEDQDTDSSDIDEMETFLNAEFKSEVKETLKLKKELNALVQKVREIVIKFRRLTIYNDILQKYSMLQFGHELKLIRLSDSLE